MPNKNKSQSKKKKTYKKNIRQYLPIVLVIVGIMMLSVSLVHQAWRKRALSPNLQIETKLKSNLTQRDLKKRPIAITFDGKTINIKPGIESPSGWTLDNQSAFIVEKSAFPGEVGNIIIYGHNTNNIFGSLKQLRVNNIIKIKLLNGEEKAYQIFDIKVVSPEEVGYLSPTGIEQLTVYTCTGLLDKNRLIVRAIPDVHR